MKAVLYLGIVIGIVGVLLMGYGTSQVEQGKDTMDSANEHRVSVPRGITGSNISDDSFTTDKYRVQYEAGEDQKNNGLLMQSYVQPVLFLALIVVLAGVGFSVRESMGVKKS